MIIGRLSACGAAIASIWLDLVADNAGLKARSDKCQAHRKNVWCAVADLRGNSDLVQR